MPIEQVLIFIGKGRVELNNENAIASIASGTASDRKAGPEANRGVSTVSFQELVRSHSCLLYTSPSPRD